MDGNQPNLEELKRVNPWKLLELIEEAKNKYIETKDQELNTLVRVLWLILSDQLEELSLICQKELAIASVEFGE